MPDSTAETGRADLSVPLFPKMPDGTPMGAMRIQADPELFIWYGDQAAAELLRRIRRQRNELQTALQQIRDNPMRDGGSRHIAALALIPVEIAEGD
ncbi:hypothetical protein LCGC14_0810520 [marine sediment metagenome]|uniref:Uncharacterized protein n=1 Tax=marine sediment metagenome TaxID=412755 RepID=A0A0F9SUF2_9ZZZZ